MALLAVRKQGPNGQLGGISAHTNIPGVDGWWHPWADDLNYTRVMLVEVDGDQVTVLRDETFTDRIDHVDEQRRITRLDNLGSDDGIHNMLWRDCVKHPRCRHGRPKVRS